MKLRKSPQELINLFGSVMPGPPAIQRQMFGYPAGFVNGNMFMGLFQEDMILRLDEIARNEVLKMRGAKQFEPMPGRPMREYIVVPPAVLQNKAKLASWIARALAFGSSLKPKIKTTKKAKSSGKPARPTPSRKKK